VRIKSADNATQLDFIANINQRNLKIMEIKIKVNKKEANHIKSPHTFYDECEPACTILKKVQKEINKKLKSLIKREVVMKNDCLICGKNILRRGLQISKWQAKRVTCSRTCSRRYRQILGRIIRKSDEKKSFKSFRRGD